MEILNLIGEVRQWLERERPAGQSAGFVPTMGALHDGHIALVKRARQENDITACSIFVNPIQFNNPEDLEKYPRTLDNDIEMLRDAGCDLVFVPSVREMYPGPVTEKYDFGMLGQVMEGKYRPGHFNGVAVVVRRLFNIIQPERAYFGEKDFQQLCIIRELVRAEKIPVEIIPCPTVREPDGLAMSSRNRRLSAEEREKAPEIYRIMLEARRMAGQVSVARTRQMAENRLADRGFVIDYVEIASVPDLQPAERWPDRGPVRIFVACYLGNVRLIDNLEIIS